MLRRINYYTLVYQFLHSTSEVNRKSEEPLLDDIPQPQILKDFLFPGNFIQLNTGFTEDSFGVNGTFRRLEGMSELGRALHSCTRQRPSCRSIIVLLLFFCCVGVIVAVLVRKVQWKAILRQRRLLFIETIFVYLGEIETMVLSFRLWSNNILQRNIDWRQLGSIRPRGAQIAPKIKRMVVYNILKQGST